MIIKGYLKKKKKMLRILGKKNSSTSWENLPFLFRDLLQGLVCEEWVKGKKKGCTGPYG